jgi:zinc/manganese transport system permease protein
VGLGFLDPIVDPALFFQTSSVHVGLVIGAVVAIVSGPVGVFTVIRGQSFAGHSLADIGSTGGSAAFLLGISPLFGFVGMGVIAAGTMELIAVRRPRGRDLATGIVLGAGLGLAALFLDWDTKVKSTTNAAQNVLFGDIFAISSSIVPVVIVFGIVALALVVVLYRPLLLSSLGGDVAAARGVPVRLVGMGYLLALAVAVSLSAVTIGAILSTALLIGPATIALRITKRPGMAIAAAIVVGVVATWLGIVLAWDSFYWGGSQRGWPVSFFVVALIFVFYLLAQAPIFGRRRARPVGVGSAPAAVSPMSSGPALSRGAGVEG